MTRPPYLILFVFLLNNCSSTIKTFQTSDQNKLGVKSNKLRGTIYKSSYPAEKIYTEFEDTLKRFTPTGNEITLVENILRSQLKHADKATPDNPINQQSIDKNLNKYFRQYVGFINNEGDKIIHINLYWEKYPLFDRWRGYDPLSKIYTSDFEMILDGGYHYWNVNVDLTKSIVERPTINGIS
jgi:hypothetical protein